MTHGVRVTTALFFVLLASSFLFVCFVVNPTFVVEIRGMNFPDLPEFSGVECLRLAFVALALWQLMLL
jgi:hypothetical protein